MRLDQPATGSGGVGSVDPAVYYARSGGNDSTGDGTSGNPYLTAQKCYDVGVLAATSFVIDLGVGVLWSITLTTNWSTHAKTIRGAGERVTSVGITWAGHTTPATNGNGSNGPDVTVEVQDLVISVLVGGQNVTVNDAGTYTAGDGGDVTITGSGVLANIYNGGGGDDASSDGILNSGSGGTTTITGSFVLGAGNDLGSTAGSPYTGGTTGTDGTINLDNCDIRAGTVNVGATDGTIALARCSYQAADLSYGTGTFSDIGGNAAYP